MNILAEKYRKRAGRYIEAAKRICYDNRKVEDSLNTPVLLLIGFALELILKADIIEQDADLNSSLDDDLIQKKLTHHGHKIEKMWGCKYTGPAQKKLKLACCQVGLENKILDEEIGLLSTFYTGNFSLRYPRIKEVNNTLDVQPKHLLEILIEWEKLNNT